jgi:hypothetical protein
MALVHEEAAAAIPDPMERTVIRDLLALLATEAHRHDGSVKIEHAHGEWRASLLNDHGDLLAVRDKHLEPTLARLWAAVGGARLDRMADVGAADLARLEPHLGVRPADGLTDGQRSIS